jgi:hypothetical protein
MSGPVGATRGSGTATGEPDIQLAFDPDHRLDERIAAEQFA